MGRNRINCDVLRPKELIIPTFNERKAGLKNKARQLGVLCGCRVALIVFPPEDHVNQDVIDLSVNGTIDEIYGDYFEYQQRHPGRQQFLHLPRPPPIPHIPQGQEPDWEGSASPSSSGPSFGSSSGACPQVQEQIQGGMQIDGYGPVMSHDMPSVYVNPNAHLGEQEQTQLLFTQNVQGMQQGHLLPGVQHPGNLRQGTFQWGNLPQYVQNHGSLNPPQHNNHVPQEQGNYVPPLQGYGTNYLPSQMSHELGVNPMQQMNQLSMSMPELLWD